MRKALVAAAVAVVTAAGVMAAPTTSATAAPPKFQHLDPGGQPDLKATLPVNVVLVGYGPEVNTGALLGGLPKQYEPVVRSRLPYGEKERLGIKLKYDFNVSRTNQNFENRFFTHLKELSRPAALTDYQKEYNQQQNNVRNVTANNVIPAPAVERWLAMHPPAGVNTARNTVFLINWYNRADFEFHTYTKNNEPDPDIGTKFGERSSRKMSAWGGTTARDEENGYGATRRVWFHDLSAGPEYFASSFDVDNADLDGDDIADYRIPPAWEYGAYRAQRALTGDLTKIVRYVALDVLFTTSPLYPVELPTSEIAKTIDIDSNTYEGWPGVNASASYIQPGLLRSELAELLTDKRLSYDNQDLPFTGEARRCFLLQWVEDDSCYPSTNLPGFANAFLQNERQLARTKDDADRVDYELPIFNYATREDYPTPLGYADDNYSDGDQSYVFAYVSPGIVDAGYGLTTTLIHEVGHHIGLSHPFDGYDSASGVDFEPTGDFYFTWLGAYSNSMMSYIDLNWDFSQFDQDNLKRFEAAALIEGANRLAGEALAGPRPGRAHADLASADKAVGRAEQAFRTHADADAVVAANEAYDLARKAAAAAGVDVEQSEALARKRREAPRAAELAHEGNEFIDTLEEGPRGAP